MVVGFDLGTTNSLVCYFDENEIKDPLAKKHFKYLHFGAEKLDFFPSVIAYSQTNSMEYQIGSAAADYLGSSSYDVYEHFKLKLGKEADKPDEKGRSMRMVACDFIQEVLKQLKRANPGETIKSIVVTIPDIWKNDPVYKVTMDNLNWIMEELNLQAAVIFESEPVSAAVYYCCEIEKNFEGHILVVDYGGGTLDLTICSVNDEGRAGEMEDGQYFENVGKLLKVHERCGDSEHAGAAFDDEITPCLLKKYAENPKYDIEYKKYTHGKRRYYKFRAAFEKSKINATEATNERLRDYYSFGGLDAKVFDISGEDDDYPVLASDIDGAFEKVNKEALTEAVDYMLEYCRMNQIDYKDTEHFRVLMVGGFSNLYCVENILRNKFEANAAVRDVRFNDDGIMPVEARTTAIASGAALIAGGFADVVYLSPCSYGFYYYSPEEEKLIPYILIERGKPEQDYREPVFTIKFRLFAASHNAALRLYFDDGRKKADKEDAGHGESKTAVTYVLKNKTLRELCPHSEAPDNYYQFGFSVGKHHIPLLHIRDKNGETRTHSLKYILDEIAIIPDR